MVGKRELIGLLALTALWALREKPPERQWVDPLPAGESAECQGSGIGGVHWTLSRGCDCAGTYRTLTLHSSSTDVTARVLDGEILLDPASNPPRFLVVQPVLSWDSQARYPHGMPGRWTLEQTSQGYRWK